MLDRQAASLPEMARFAVAWVDSDVLGRPDLMRRRGYVEAQDLRALEFDPQAMARRAEAAGVPGKDYPWTFDPAVMDRHRTVRRVRGAS